MGMVVPDPRDTGFQFALECLADPHLETDGLRANPLTMAYRVCWEKLLFVCGRQTGLVEYGHDEAQEFLEGFLAGLLDGVA